MKPYKSILSILLLGIYSVVVMHNIVPHFHCDTDTNFTNAEADHDLHAGMHHSHQHKDHDDAESSWFDAFLGLLGDLEHHELGEGHFENFTAQSQSFDFNISTTDIIIGDIVIVNTISDYNFTIDHDNNFTDWVPIIYEQHLVCYAPLRGPPSKS